MEVSIVVQFKLVYNKLHITKTTYLVGIIVPSLNCIYYNLLANHV